MTTRKILSLVLALVMVCSLIVVGVYADEATADPTLIPTLGKGPQTEGAMTGVPTDAIDITYLSDLHNADNTLALNDYVVAQLNNSKIMLDQNYNGDLLAFNGQGGRKQIKTKLDANGERTLENGISYKPTDIALGYNGVKYAKGLGVHPSGVGADDRAIVYNVANLGNHFYAVAGATGYEITVFENYRRVEFEVLGSKAETYSDDAAFELLAHAQGIRCYNVAEFNLDITGYNFIKLVVKMDPTSDSNSSCAVAWGGACLYNLPAAGGEEPSEPSETPSEPSETPSEPSETPSEPTVAPRDPYKYFSSVVNGLTAEEAATATDISVSDFIVGSYVYPASGSNDPRPVNVDAAFKGAELKVGANAYTQGFGMHISPDANHTYVLLDVSSVKGNRLNTLVGITGTLAGDAERAINFRIYGGNSKDGEFELLADSNKFSGAEVGEFDLYIGDYKFLKLEVANQDGQSHSGGAVAFINPVIYEGSAGTADTFNALPVALLILSGAAVAVMVCKKKED